MIQYEYKRVVSNPIEMTEEKLNELGSCGWKLNMKWDSTFVFCREVIKHPVSELPKYEPPAFIKPNNKPKKK